MEMLVLALIILNIIFLFEIEKLQIENKNINIKYNDLRRDVDRIIQHFR